MTVGAEAAPEGAGSAGEPVTDRHDRRLAIRATGRLAQFNAAGVLDAGDVHVSTRLSDLAGESGEEVRLAAALAVRASRLGHVFVDLSRPAITTDADAEIPQLPELDGWRRAVAESPLVLGDPAPLRLSGARLYLARLWDDEVALAADLLALAWDFADVDQDALSDGIERLAGEQDAAAAARVAVGRHLSVIAGGPGTGKTTTVARILALLMEQAEAMGHRPPVIGLCAPTGKAAQRLAEAVAEQAELIDAGELIRQRLRALRASTVHRLLGPRADSRSRFRHDRGNRLPHDIVVVDETSMVSLPLMARLVEAVRPGGRLVLLGDPDQLASVEAGAVLGDIVGPARTAELTRAEAATPIGRSVVRLRRVHRFGPAIAAVADAIRRGDADGTLQALSTGERTVVWVAADATERGADLTALREAAVAAGVQRVAAARAGDADTSLDALGRFRLLCAHRRGPYGVSRWGGEVTAWLEDALPDLDSDSLESIGRPLLVGRTDREIGLLNGDNGVIVRTADGPMASFRNGGSLRMVAPLRLTGVSTLHAMTIHKSQGSQFDTAAAILPPPESPLMTRELLYTAVTRARARLIVIGTETALRAAVERPVARSSGLGERLWGASGYSPASSP